MTSLPFRDRLARHLWRLTPQRTLSDFIGWWASVNVPKGLHSRVLETFVAKYKIDVSEAELPLLAYPSVNEFFTRKLKPGVRPIDPDPASIVSPADGKIVATGLVSATGTIEAKNIALTTAALLTDEALAKKFVGGAFAVTYLSPRDYHRVHTPAAGSVLCWHHVPGQLFPVNEATVRREPDLFARNERFVSVFEGDVGTFAVVMVAAVGVGHVTAAYDPEVQTHKNAPAGQVLTKVFATPPHLGKGDEVGIFHLGSTAIILFEPGRVILEPTEAAKPIRMGERVGRLAR
ncbi:MAG: archaetidylserine decarboxylase [Deltaproteobacteria bacterium]|nr:archaetidylserine decarboxylase [Deltaproteobacteria bacterium]